MVCNNMLDPPHVAGDPHEDVREPGLGAARPEGDDARQVPPTVGHVAVEGSAGVSVAGTPTPTHNGSGAQVVIADGDVVTEAVHRPTVASVHHLQLHLEDHNNLGKSILFVVNKRSEKRRHYYFLAPSCNVTP